MYGLSPELCFPCGDGARLELFRGVDDGALSRLRGSLLSDGFALCDAYSAAGNDFAFFRRGGESVALSRFDGELRAVTDPFSAALPCPREQECERLCPTTVWQLEVDHTLIDCGMCFVVRCADGSFFIVDSGHYYQMNDNCRLHRFLRRLTPEGKKIRIAGWFLTHAHSDHVCKFYDFLRYNMDDCELEAVYYNFPEAVPVPGIRWNPNGNRIEYNLNALLAELDVPKIKLHTGMRFAVRNLSFTVLCTHEDVYPSDTEDFNNSSTVLMMEAEGSRVLFCGDAGEEQSKIMVRRWGELLRCEILQVAHHGHHGCSAEFYRLADARAALFSNTQIFFDLDLQKEREANAEILSRCDEYHISSNGTVGADLPYVKFVRQDDETFEDFDKIRTLWGYVYTPERKAELYAAYLARGGKPLHSFDRDPLSDWGEV